MYSFCEYNPLYCGVLEIIEEGVTEVQYRNVNRDMTQEKGVRKKLIKKKKEKRKTLSSLLGTIKLSC